MPDAAARAHFFADLAETADVRAAASRAGFGFTQLRQWRRADPAFAAEWEEAVAAARESLELQLLARDRPPLSGPRRLLVHICL